MQKWVFDDKKNCTITPCVRIDVASIENLKPGALWKWGQEMGSGLLLAVSPSNDNWNSVDT